MSIKKHPVSETTLGLKCMIEEVEKLRNDIDELKRLLVSYMTLIDVDKNQID